MRRKKAKGWGRESVHTMSTSTGDATLRLASDPSTPLVQVFKGCNARLPRPEGCSDYLLLAPFGGVGAELPTTPASFAMP